MLSREDALFKLLRIALGKELEINLPQYDDWEEIREIAFEQGVNGLALSGLDEIFANQPETKLSENNDCHTIILIKWVGYGKLSEKQYALNLKLISELGFFFNEFKIPLMLLKGYGLSLNYPEPEKRPSGNIDLFFFGKWREADELVTKQLNINVDTSHHHHTVYRYMDQSIENHYDFINVYSHSSNRKIEEHLKKLASDKGEELLLNVYAPPSLLDAEFTALHAAVHFASGEMTLRHIVDWLLLVEKKGASIDWNSFWEDVEWIGIKPFILAIIGIGYKYLNFNQEISIYHKLLTLESRIRYYTIHFIRTLQVRDPKAIFHTSVGWLNAGGLIDGSKSWYIQIH